jgi:hypothetical protein
MNSDNDHVVTGEFFKKLREAGVDGGYEPIPANLQAEAARLLNGKDEAFATRANAPGLAKHAKRQRVSRNKAKALRRKGVPGY